MPRSPLTKHVPLSSMLASFLLGRGSARSVCQALTCLLFVVPTTGLASSVDAWAYTLGGNIVRRMVAAIESAGTCADLLTKISKPTPAYAQCMAACLPYGDACLQRCNVNVVRLMEIAIDANWASSKYPDHLSRRIRSKVDFEQLMQQVSNACK